MPGQTVLFETVKYGLYRLFDVYELDVYDNEEPLRLELFRHAHEQTRFRARIYQPVLFEKISSERNDSRLPLVEYTMLHRELSSFHADDEKEAFGHVIKLIIQHTDRQKTNRPGLRDQNNTPAGGG